MRLFKRAKSPTIRQFQELLLLEKDQSTQGLDRELRFAAIMEGISYEEAAERLTLLDIARINAASQIPPDIWDPVARLPRYVWIRGRLFRVCRDFTALSLGEFAAFEHFTRTPNVSLRELHNILALLTRPVRLRDILTAKRWRESWGRVRRDHYGRLVDPERLPEEAPRQFLERAIWMQDNAPAYLAARVSAFFLRVWDVLLHHISQPGTRIEEEKRRGIWRRFRIWRRK